jgi:8-oxo-dGTP diphosphatase
VSEEVVRAAGVVVWRERDDGEVAFLLVHRSQYDDWSFPKGKNEPGEPDDDCAMRETAEETSVVATLGPELASTRYTDAKGRPKLVRYWLGQASNPDSARAQHEVDAVTWVTAEEAARMLSHERDLDVLDSAVAALAATRER